MRVMPLQTNQNKSALNHEFKAAVMRRGIHHTIIIVLFYFANKMKRKQIQEMGHLIRV